MIRSNAEIGLLTIILAPIVAFIIALGLRKYVNRSGGQVGKSPPFSTSFVMSQCPTSLGDSLNEQFSKYGKIFTTKFHGKEIMVSADLDLNNFVLKNEKLLFHNDVPSHVLDLLGHNSLFLMADDQRYKHIKSSVIGFLHSWEIRTSLIDEVHTAADRILNSWRQKDSVLLSEQVEKFNFNIIVNKTVGLNTDQPEGEQLRREFFVLSRGLFAFPSNLPDSPYIKALNARENIIKIIKKKVDSKKMEEKSTKPADWIDWLLENNPEASEETSFYDAVIQLSLAGLFTTASTLALAIYFLSNCPKAVQQLREEYQQILRAKDNKAKLIWEDYENLKFTKCVINEVLRLGNVVAFLPKKAKQDIDFKGFVIPKGTPIILYIQAMHLDPTGFENPGIFNPWRWESLKKSNNWIPFGGGIRQCNGEQIARLQITVFLHRFLLNYNWEAAEPDHPTVRPVYFPKNLPIRLYPLNPTF